jgi:hypothetical protein
MTFLRLLPPRCAIASLIFCGCVAVCAVAQTSAHNGTDQSWTASTQVVPQNANPERTTESHTKSGNRTLDKKSVEVLNADGKYEPYFEVEIETVRENATTRSIARTYNPGVNGEKQLSQVTEEETQNSGNGDANIVRTTSNPDSNGNLQVVQREVTNTITKGPDSQDTQTTIYLIDISGKLAPSMQVHEQQERGVNGDLKATKTTLLQDGNGRWQAAEIAERTVKEDGQNRSTEVRVSRRDFEGNVSPVSQVVAKDTQVNGQARETAETYSIDVPGSARDGKLHLVQRATTVQKNEPGRTTTKQEVEQPDPGDPQAGLGVTTKTTDTLVSGVSGTEETNTISVQYPGASNFTVVSVETKKSEQIPAIQVQISPADKAK